LFISTFLFVLFIPGSAEGVAAARAFREANGPEILRTYVDLLEIPNIAADLEGVTRTAEHLRASLEDRGVRTELWRLPGVPPIVYGELETPGAERTLLVYVHYDGQPADPANWRHPPFSPTLYTAAMEAGGEPRPFPDDGEAIDPEWRIYARSASDDKAPIPAMLAALDALREAGLALTSSFKFFFEGEEEAGSPNLGTYLARYRDRLDGDLWLFFDGPMHQSRRPQLVFGVRGVTGLEVTVYGANRSLHSGHYGNYAPVPGQLLAGLLASMKADDGRVLIEGFYDTVAPLDETTRAALAALPDIDTDLRAELGLHTSEGHNAPYAGRLLLPALTIKGLASGNVGALARNVIPATATASIGLRLVKGNDPEHMLDLVERHIRALGFHIVEDAPDAATRARYPKLARLTRETGYPAARTDMDHPVAALIAKAMDAASEDEIVRVPTLGGSLPLYLFTEILGQDVVIVPIANHDNNQHAPNENLRIANLWYGIDLYAALFTM